MTDEPDGTRPIDFDGLAGGARAEFDGGAARDGGAELGTSQEAPGDRLGHYELVRRLGEGGMGTVWEARQTAPVERRVALKIIRAGMDTERFVARFAAERRALAMMEHPGIAAVLDAGATERGRPYLVMELVHGAPVTDHARARGLDLRARLELFVDICAAVHHAHQKGIVHRDIKPSNVLVTDVDGRPMVKVIDFGIARIVDGQDGSGTRLTAEQEVIGTLECMAPEQTGGAAGSVDSRTDVYGLGVLLYELVTGVRPFAFDGGETLEERLQRVRHEDPPRPSLRLDEGALPRPRRAREELARDVDWIALRALEKDPARRYPSASELAADVRRFLAGETIEARPPSRVYRIAKFVTRHRGLVVGTAAVGVTLLAGIAGTGVGLVRALDANEDLREAVAAKERARARAETSSQLLSELVTRVAPKLARGKDTELLEGILEDASSRLLAGEVADPYVAAELDGTLGQGLASLGRFEEALVHLERADAAAGTLGDIGADAGRESRRLLGEGLFKLERLGEARELLEELVDRDLDELGLRHPETLAARRALGLVLHRLGDVDAAHGLLGANVPVEREVYGPAAFLEKGSLLDLATLEFFGRGRPDRAEPMLAEFAELAEESLGAEHPLTLRAGEVLSQAYAAMGRFDEAFPLLDQLGERVERIFGPEHRETLLFEANRAITLFQAGRVDESEPLARGVLEAQRRVLGPDDPDALWLAMHVATYDAMAGRFAEARTTMEGVIERIEATGRPAVEERFNLAVLLRDMGDAEASVASFEALLEGPGSRMPPGHPLRRALLSGCALSCRAAGDDARAAELEAELASLDG